MQSKHRFVYQQCTRQWVSAMFDKAGIENPFGHSARRISDYWAGLQRKWSETQSWKRYRVTTHDHNPVNDAMGNVEAFATIQAQLTDLKPLDPEANSRPSKSPQLNQLIYTQVLELIGEDFKNWGELDTEHQHFESLKNDLRKELRAKAKAKFINDSQAVS